MIEMFNMDCMEYMAGLEDNAFELAIVDPHYGIGAAKTKGIGRGRKNEKFVATVYKPMDWDNSVPDNAYFIELNRVSKNQIIWGYNYFSDMLPACKGVIFWDKMIGDNDFSAGELAFTSYDKSLKKVSIHYGGNRISSNSAKAKLFARIHPTQKPVKLYQWLLKNYAKPGDRILDTHLGSASSAIAAHNMGFDFVGTELDKDYFDLSQTRYANETAQERMFI